MNLEMERIALLADRLRLPQLTSSLPLLAEEAARKDKSYSEFLLGLLEEEAVRIARGDEDVRRALGGREVERVVYVPDRVLNLVV